MDNIIQQFLATLTTYLPNVLAALGILIGGWLLALIAAAITRGFLRRTTLDDRLATIIRGEQDADTGRLDIERWVSKAVFYLIMLFVLVAFLQALNLTLVAGPINLLLNQILAFVPQALGAAALLLVAWVIGTALKFIVVRVAKAAKLDERLASQADVAAPEGASIGTTLGNVAYWLVFLLLVPAILGVLGLQGLLEPASAMVDEILRYLPNLLAVGLILLVGWVAARLLRQIIANLAANAGLDRLGEQAGVTTALGGQRLSHVLGTIVYVLAWIPVVITAVNALEIAAISDPASQMLTVLLNALPAIFGAILLLGFAYFIAKITGGFVTSVLTGVGFNKVLSWLGLEVKGGEGTRTASEIVGYLTTIGVMLFAVIMAANLLGFAVLATLVSGFLVAAAQVLVGLVIFGLGLYLASLAFSVIKDAGGSQARLLAPTARGAIIVFAAALALRQMGIADEIVNLAFGLLLGAIAVAVALAFGLGSRDIAAKEVDRWLRSIRGSQSGED